MNIIEYTGLFSKSTDINNKNKKLIAEILDSINKPKRDTPRLRISNPDNAVKVNIKSKYNKPKIKIDSSYRKGRTILGAGIGAVGGGTTALLLSNNLKKKLEAKHPDWTDQQLEKELSKRLKIRAAIGSTVGAGVGALGGYKLSKSIGKNKIKQIIK